jgi:hypothetical protein
MRPIWVGLVTLVSLGLPSVLSAQRLSADFATVAAPHWRAEVPAASMRVTVLGSNSSCRKHRGLKIVAGALSGAAAGWLAYHLLVDPWTSDPDPKTRRFGTLLVVGGAVYAASDVVLGRGPLCRPLVRAPN